VHAWLMQHPDVLEQYLPLKDVDNAPARQPGLIVTKRMWRGIQMNTTGHDARIFKIRSIKTMIAAAAVFAAFLCINKITQPAIIKQATIKQPVATVETPETQKAYVTNETQSVQNVLLADGSTVKLYPQSSLEYDEPFGKLARTIVLKGKAFFDVKKKPASPFVVTASYINVTVLGTQFTIDATKKAKDDDVMVHLFTGKIMLTYLSDEQHKNHKPVYMHPGDVKHINKHSFTIAPQKNTIQPATQKSVIEFKEVPLYQVFAQLETRYGISIQRSSSNIDNIIFSGSFQSTEAPRSILQVIASVNNLFVSQSNNTFIIKNN